MDLYSNRLAKVMLFYLVFALAEVMVNIITRLYMKGGKNDIKVLNFQKT